MKPIISIIITGILLTVLVLFIIAIINIEGSHNYVVTDKGLMSHRQGSCRLGLLIDNDSFYILDEDNKQIRCTGQVVLTDSEFEAWVTK